MNQYMKPYVTNMIECSKYIIVPENANAITKLVNKNRKFFHFLYSYEGQLNWNNAFKLKSNWIWEKY